MKYFKNRVLSVLLFAFSILIIHDYVIVDSSIKNGSVYSQYTKTDKSHVDAAKQVHSKIHVVLDVPLEAGTFIPMVLGSKKIFDTEVASTSYIGSVPQRPPLS